MPSGKAALCRHSSGLAPIHQLFVPLKRHDWMCGKYVDNGAEALSAAEYKVNVKERTDAKGIICGIHRHDK